MKRNIKKYFTRGIIAISLLNILNALLLKWHLIFLQKEQILSIFSSIAQIVAAFISVSIAVYGILDIKSKTVDVDSDEAAVILHENLFDSLLGIIVCGVIDIALCMLTLALFESVDCLYDIFSTESIFLLAFLVFNLFCFANYLNPKEIVEVAKRISNEMEREYEEKGEEIPYDKFIVEYNRLESRLIEFSQKIVKNKEYYNRPRLTDALQILQQNEILDWQMGKVIRDVQRYRNALVHNCDRQSVSVEIYEKLFKNLEYLNNIFEIYSEQGEKSVHEKVQMIRSSELYQEYEVYIKKNLLTDLERAICDSEIEDRTFTEGELKKWKITREDYEFKRIYLKKAGLIDRYKVSEK